MEKKTYGQILQEHAKLKHTMDDDVIEYRRPMEQQIIQSIYATIDAAKNQPLYLNKDFYVVVGFKIERIGQQPTTKVWARRSCPTPVFKQSVWKYYHQNGGLEFLWTLPDSLLYYHMLGNKQKYLGDKETSDLAKFVILDNSGELLDWVKKENGEKPDAVILINS